MILLLPIGDTGHKRKFPIVNYLIIASNIAIYFIGIVFFDYSLVVRQYGFTPAEFVNYTLVSAQFLHANIAHLFGNMLFLWIVGDNVEDYFGHILYPLVYVVCGAIGMMGHYVFTDQEYVPTIGASASISGIMGAYFILFPFNLIKVFYIFFFLFFWDFGVFRIPAILGIGLWFGSQFLLGLVSRSDEVLSTGVAYWAHIFGFLAGVIIALFMTRIIGKKPWKPIPYRYYR